MTDNLEDTTSQSIEIDNLLFAILHYTDEFYGVAIKHGLGASVSADAVQHVVKAARRLHALALERRAEQAAAPERSCNRG